MDCYCAAKTHDIPHMFIMLASLLTMMLCVGGVPETWLRFVFSFGSCVSISLYVRWGVVDLRRMVNAFVSELLIVSSLGRWRSSSYGECFCELLGLCLDPSTRVMLQVAK